VSFFYGQTRDLKELLTYFGSTCESTVTHPIFTPGWTVMRAVCEYILRLHPDPDAVIAVPAMPHKRSPAVIGLSQSEAFSKFVAPFSLILLSPLALSL
jgi:hypothetical protein